MSDKHEHVFKERQVNISNGQRFITEKCECGMTKQSSKSTKEQSKFHKLYGKIEIKRQE